MSVRRRLFCTGTIRSWKDPLNEKDLADIEQKLKRLSRVKLKEKEGQRRGAVLVPLVNVGGIPSILLTQRSSKLKSHSGQVAFPGGVQDEGDQGDFFKTAKREAFEEIGLKEESIRFLGFWHDALSTNNVAVTPVVSFLNTSFKDQEQLSSGLLLNKEEVELTFSLPLSHFFDEKNISYMQHTHSQRLISYRGPKDGIQVWGLTAYFIHHLLPFIFSK